jgi:hypothetical protein
MLFYLIPIFVKYNPNKIMFSKFAKLWKIDKLWESRTINLLIEI